MSPAAATDRFQGTTQCEVLVLTSRKAGSGASRDQIPRLEKLLGESGVGCKTIADPEELQDQLRQAAESAEPVVVAAGGDGTLSLVAASIQAAGLDIDVPIVPMPMGTENLLARHFGHTADAQSVAETIQYGAPYWIDAGKTNDRLFLIMATCGFDAEVVRGMHLTRRGHIWKISYLRPIVRAMFKYKFPRINIRIDGGEPFECRWAMVFNLPRYGGELNIEPDAVGDDGQMDVIAFTGGSVISGMKYIAGIWAGRHRDYRDVIRHRGSSIEITSEGRVPYQLDGDYAGRLPLSIETIPKSVQLLLPRAAS